MKPRICFAITSITDNGVTRVVSILLDEINYDQYDVTVLLTRKVPHRFELNSKARIIEVKHDLGKGAFGKLRSIFELHQILKRERFETVIALGDYAAMYVLLACFGVKVKKIVSERNDPNREPGNKAFRQLRDILYKGVDILVCQTNDAASYFEGIVEKRVVIHNPISANLPQYDGIQREKRIVNFCRIDEQKNLPMLIDAFGEFSKKHYEYRMEIYGDGPLKEQIMAYIAQKGLAASIVLHGYCRDIHEKIKNVAMFVSSSDFEGMSNSMLEALAIGIPTICTDCPIGGAREIIESGENGILVPVNDRTAMADAMCFFAENPEEAERMAENGMKIRETLCKDTICCKWWELL